MTFRLGALCLYKAGLILGYARTLPLYKLQCLTVPLLQQVLVIRDPRIMLTFLQDPLLKAKETGEEAQYIRQKVRSRTSK